MQAISETDKKFDKSLLVPFLLINTLVLASVYINPLYAIIGFSGLIIAGLVVRTPEMLLAVIINGFYILWIISKPYEKHNEFIFLTKLLVLFGILIIWWRYRISIRFLFNPIFISTFLLGLFMLYGVQYSIAPTYGLWKTGFFFMNNIFVLGTVAFLSNSIERTERFYFYLIAFGILLGFSGLLQQGLGLGEKERLEVFDITTIWISRMLGLAIILCSFFYGASSRKKKTIIIIAVLVALVVMLLTISRAPMLGLMLTTLFYFFYFSKKSIVRKLGYLTSGLALIVISLMILPESLTERFLEYSGRKDVSGLMRLVWFKKVLPVITENHLFGIGTGGFGKLITGTDIRAYPHNIFAEIGLENGLIGLVLFCSFLYFTVKYGKQILQNTEPNSKIHRLVTCAFLVLVFGLFNALFSGDSPWNEQIWLASGIILGLYTYHLPSNSSDKHSILGAGG